MGCTLAELDGRMDPLEFVAWQAYFRVEPHETDKADVRAAIGAWTTASVMSSGKGRRPKFEDFVPKWDARERGRRRDPEELRVALEARLRASGVKFREVPRGDDADGSGPRN